MEPRTRRTDPHVFLGAPNFPAEPVNGLGEAGAAPPVVAVAEGPAVPLLMLPPPLAADAGVCTMI